MVVCSSAAPGSGRRGSTCSRHMRCISRGGPGSATSSFGEPPRVVCTNQPGAVPTGLGRALALGISHACLRLISGMARPRDSYRPRRCASCAGSSVGVSFRAAAMASRVRSSSVGPRPPPRMTRSARSRAVPMASVRRGRLSPSTVLRCRVTPRAPSSRARNAALLSTISPNSSSVPTLIISARSITTSAQYRPKRNVRPVNHQTYAQGRGASSVQSTPRP